MRYLRLVFNDERKLDTLPEREWRGFEPAHPDDEEIEERSLHGR
jgi:hypothetical protein